MNIMFYILKVQECWATPSSNPNGPIQYDLIAQG